MDNMHKVLLNLGMDYLISNGELTKYTDSFIGDCVWHYSHETLPIFLLTFWDTRIPGISFVQSILSSCSHFRRLTQSFSYSAIDLVLSSVLSKVSPTTNYFSSNSSTNRCLRRLAFTLKRNGGVYHDFLEILVNLNVIGGEHFPKSISSNVGLSNSEFFSLIRPIQKYFQKNQFQFQHSEGLFHFYQGRLLSGEKVSLTCISPHEMQRRKLDLFPFKIISSVTSIIPFLKPESNLLKNIISQLDYSIPKEISSRCEILKSFGVNFNQSPFLIFHQARNSGFALFVPAPLQQFSTKNVLVSDYVCHRNWYSSTEAFGKVFFANNQLLEKCSKILPNVSLPNILNSDFGITLKSFSSLCRVNKYQFTDFLSDSRVYQPHLDLNRFSSIICNFPNVSVPGFQLLGNYSRLSSISVNELASNIQSFFDF